MMTTRLLLLAAALAACWSAAPISAEEKPAQIQVQTRNLYLQLIHQARADGRARAALAYLDDFDRQFPNDLDARVLRVNSLLDLGQVDKADAVLATLARSPARADLDAARGHALAARSLWAQAVPFYEKAAVANPTDPLMKNALGYALLRSRNIDRAVEQLRNAADLAPGDEVIRNNLILAFVLDGRKAQADKEISRVADVHARAALSRMIADEATRLGTTDAAPTTTRKKVA